VWSEVILGKLCENEYIPNDEVLYDEIFWIVKMGQICQSVALVQLPKNFVFVV